MTSAQVRTLISIETRALWPTWAAGVLAASVAAVTNSDVHHFSQFACGTAMIALGAQSIGHEYAHRTLGLTLTLPIDRRRLFLVKLAVAGAMVLPLAAYAWVLGLFVDVLALTVWHVAAIALCLAPSLTMLCRSQLAGAVFSWSVPWIALMAVMIATGTTFDAPPEVERAAFATWSGLMVPVLASGAVLGWWLFMRLEWIEGAATGVQLKWRTGAPRDAAPMHPQWQLVKKEFRLQHMTFAITSLYLGSCAAAVVFDLPGPEIDVPLVAALTLIYVLGIPALIGSLATAEERQLGTLVWQLQLPTPVWQQWAAKVATVFGLTLVLSMVPALVVPMIWRPERPFIELPIILPIVMAATSMYISSLCATAVRAVVASVVSVSFVLWLVLAPELWTGRSAGSVVLLSVVCVLLVAFAFVNHRPDPPYASRIWRQTLSLAALIGFGVIVLGTAPPF